MMRTAFAALAVFALLSTSSAQTARAPKPERPARPALWKVVDRDTTVYLFGTMHLLPRDLVWTGRKIDRAIDGSQGLVLETLLDKDPAKTGAIMTQLGMAPGLPPLAERVPPEQRAALSRVVAKSGIPVAVLDRFETWAAALTLASVGLKSLPVSADHGAEAVLRARFEQARKPVEGLETPAQQLGYFDALPESAQRMFLASVVEDDSHALAEFDKMIAAWKAGDTKAIALTFDDELRLSPELTENLLRTRNANWAAWVEARMDRPGTVFVAVGAGHLAGDGSVEDLLKRRGFRVSRVQ